MNERFDLLQTRTERVTGRTECFNSKGHSSCELQRPTDLNLWILQIFAGVNLCITIEPGDYQQATIQTKANCAYKCAQTRQFHKQQSSKLSKLISRIHIIPSFKGEHSSQQSIKTNLYTSRKREGNRRMRLLGSRGTGVVGRASDWSCSI
jgi:hypothetical protein